MDDGLLPARHMRTSSSLASLHSRCSSWIQRVRSPADPAPRPAPQGVQQLPDDLTHAIFAVLMDLEGAPRPVAALSLVCRRWYNLCRHEFVCEAIAKRFVVAYPLLRLRDGMPDAVSPLCLADVGGPSPSLSPTPSAGCRHQRSASCDADSGLRWRHPQRPTPTLLRATVEEMLRHSSDVRYKRVVARRRGYVLHTFISLSLFFFACFISIAMCTLEGLDPITLNNAGMAFACLWATYIAVLGAVLSNVIMAAHFEPQPLVPRIRRNLQLIAVTAVVVGMCSFAVALPTWMAQRNVLAGGGGGELEFEWWTCASPLLMSLALWQCEALYSVRRSFVAWLRAPTLSAVYTGAAHLTPLLFALAVASVAEYLRTAQWGFLLVSGVPLFITFFILAIIFLMDFSASHREAEGVAGLCLLSAAALPVCLVAFPFRGFVLLPGALSVWGFFLSHLLETKKKIELVLLDSDDDDDEGLAVME